MPFQLADPFPRTAIAAAIKRATFAAHKSVKALDAGALKDLERIYQRSATEIAGAIAANAGMDGNLALQELQSTLGQVNVILQQLSQQREILLQGALQKSASLGVQPYAAAIDAGAASRVSQEALNFVRTFVAADGLQLSDRVWRLDRGAKDLVTNAIEQAVIQGHGAAQAATQFLVTQQKVPADIEAKISKAQAKKLGKSTGQALMKGPGAPMANAMRLFRTEINRAHGEAYMRGGEDIMGFAGWRFLLSPAHPKPDICDLLSEQNLYGLGNGVYPTREKTPWPAHPNTLSFLEIVFEDEVTEADKAGKETPMQAMKRLSPDRQKGVLGAGKFELYKDGKISQGMIKTPLEKVKKRVTSIDAAKDKAEITQAQDKARENAQKAMERAAAAAKAQAAQSELDAIAKAGKGPQFQALKQLQKTGAMGKGADPQDILAQIGQLATQLQSKKQIGDALSKYKKAVLAGKQPPPAAAKAFDGLPDAEKKAFLDKIEKAKPVSPPADPEQLRIGDFEQIGPQRGSNPGGLFRSKATGEQWYIKTPASEDFARNEVLANRLYHATGIDVPEIRLIDYNGKVGVASKVVPNLKSDPAALAAGKVPGAVDGFAIDAWLANWDVAGMSFDNLLVGNGRAWRIDTGGALRYRAQGGLKGSQWGPTVSELESLRNAQANRQTAQVFSQMTKAQLQASAQRLKALGDDDIRQLVKRYGPLDAKEAGSLADTLIARKADIIRRILPDDVPAPAPRDALARVTEAEHRMIRESRINGYAIPTDKDQIEDQQVLMWHEKTADGKPRTVAQFKVQGAASQKLAKLLHASGSGAAFDDGGVYAKLLEAIKGVASQAAKGEALRDKDLQRTREAVALFAKVAKGIDSAAQRAAFQAHFQPWLDALRKATQPGLGSKPSWNQPGGTLKQFTPPPEPAQPGAIRFERRTGAFEKKRIERGFVRSTGEKNYDPSHFYEANIGGTRLRYWANSPDVPFAMRNQVELAVDGDDIDGARKAFSAIRAIGVNSDRASPFDREELYLRQIAYHRRDGYANFTAMADRVEDQEARVAAMKAWLNEATGIDITKVRTYNPDGAYQAFGQGRKFTYRPDLQGKDWDKFQNAYVLHHKITQGNLVDSLDSVLNAGGQMAPTVDKLRRGLPIGGMSPTADLETGGANYFFTRIKSRATAFATEGITWKSRLVSRLDAISYDSDMFGRTSDNTVLQNRKSTIEEWRAAARHGSNETIFKNSLSLFDDVEAIIVSPNQYERVLAVFRKHGYATWPDGRRLEDVVKRIGSV